MDTKLDKIELLEEKCIDIILNSDTVFTFNYTKLAEQYGVSDLHYVHGSLENEIILGIPYSREMDCTNFQHVSKYHKVFTINETDG